MKKGIWTFVVMVVYMMPLQAEVFESDGLWFETTSDQTVMLVPEPFTPGEGAAFVIRNYYSGDIQIPETVTYQDVEYSVTAAQNSTFRGSADLTGVAIPASLVDLGPEPFADCPMLTSISVDTGNTAYAVADGLLYDKGLSTLIACPGGWNDSPDVPSSVTSVAASAFRGCSKIPEVVLPETVTDIGKYAFYGCYQLASVNLPEGVAAIPDSTFFFCTSLATLSMPSTVRSVGVRAFYNCNHLTSLPLPDALETIDDYAFSLCYGVREIQLPSALRTIGYKAFENCSKVKKINIPASVSEIRALPFAGCTSLYKIIVAEENTSFSSLDGVLYDKAQTTLLCYPSAKLGDFTLPSSVNTIGEYGFYSCRFLENIELKSSLTTIKEGAFRLCRALKSITVPSSVTVLGDNLFVACSSMEAFLFYAPTPLEISPSTFTDDDFDVPLYVLERALDDYKNAPYWSQFKTILPISSDVVPGLVGDVNDDGFINMTDVTLIINYILGKESTEFKWQMADVNFDGFINMTDVSSVINVILGK